MKNTFRILKFLIIGILLFSCDDSLEQLPQDGLNAASAFRTVADLQAGLNTAYNDYDANTVIEFNSIFTDNTKLGIDNGGQQVPLHSLFLDETSGDSFDLWRTRYGMINNATRVIEAVDLITREDGDEDEVNHILGQAYALRAFAHFELFQYYTPDYLNPDGISVPAIDYIVTVEDNARNTVSEVLSLINEDLNTSSQLLDPSEAGNPIFINQDFITALRARISLFTADYSSALARANELIDDYPLANRDQYVDMFLDADNTEVIWKAQRVNGDQLAGGIWNFQNFGPFIEMSNSLYDLFDQDDVRFGVNYSEEFSNPNAGVYIIYKYPGSTFQYLSDMKTFRVSEMYLIRAEALARNQNFDDAESTLKQLRDARFGFDTDRPSFNNLNDALDFIVTERRLELAYEAHRYLDLKRLGLPLERADEDCSELSNACTLSPNDRRFTLPIPGAELNGNDLMIQNDGY
ncbi:RagB/SusD family nutrient uptake outer membrane protein [Gangjinia marincola]|uniref:RagB/SusD family nutrient uptake outer membrane protein n=1 Tax=Gangjinia marincola TaxID=578463 RepID=A0ABN1MK59_9FLAO